MTYEESDYLWLVFYSCMMDARERGDKFFDEFFGNERIGVIKKKWAMWREGRKSGFR